MSNFDDFRAASRQRLHNSAQTKSIRIPNEKETTLTEQIAPNLPYEDGDFYEFEALLTDAERARLEELREFFQAEVRPIAVDCWNKEEFPHHMVPRLAEVDLVSPERRRGFSNLYAGMQHAEFTRADASIAGFFGVHDKLFTNTIELLASEEQKADWLPDIYALKKIGAFGMTEPLGGSDVARGTRTTAERKGNSWVLNGEKKWIGNSTFSDWVLIFARDVADNQVKAFMVDTKLPGYSAVKTTNKISLRTIQNGEITLDNVIVDDYFRLANANSFKDLNEVLRPNRIAVAWQAVGMQRAALDIARRYTAERLQFGKPIASYQLVQERLVTMLSNTVASTGMAVRLSQLEDQGLAKDEHASLAKAFNTTRTRETVAIARALLGGNGILTEYEAAKIFGDAESHYTFEGTYELNSLIVGRAITGISAIV